MPILFLKIHHHILLSLFVPTIDPNRFIIYHIHLIILWNSSSMKQINGFLKVTKK